MKKNKLTYLWIMIVGIVIVLTVNVYAVSQTIVSLTSVSCYAGDTITLNLSIPQNSGFSRARIALKYDEDVFTLTKKATDKGLIPGGFHSDKLESPYKLSWETASNAKDTYAEGIAAELTFKVSSTVKPGKYEIEVVIMDDSVISADGKSVDVQGINGTIYVVQNPATCSHSWDDWISSSLKQHKRSCQLCSKVQYDSHDWDDGEITRKPTEDSTGVMTYTCDTCDATKTETIPALEPDEYEITGTVTSYGDADEAVTVTLYDAYGDVVDSDTTTNGSYSLSAPEGEYTLEVSKSKHCTREYLVDVSGSNVEQDVEIWLYGDVYTADGGVSMVDATQIQRYLSGKSSVFGSTTDTELEKYRLKVADIYTADGGVSMVDATQIQRYLSGKSSIFNTLP